MKVQLNGRKLSCLLDTGCEVSIIGHCILPDVSLEPTNRKLYAANGTEIPLLGKTTVEFSVQGRTYSASLAVSEAIQEMILGIDWLQMNESHWDFGSGSISIGGRSIKLCSRPQANVVRRIYVGGDCEVTSHSQTDVPVQITWPDLRTKSEGWALEPKAVRDGVIVARTLMADHSLHSAVRVVNTTDKPNYFKAGTYLGEAEAVQVCHGATQADAETAMVGSIARDNGYTSGQSGEISGRNDCLKDFSHIQCVIDALPPDLTEGQRSTATGFLHEYAGIFSRSDFDLGRSSLLEHTIDTGDHHPFRQSLHRHPIAHLQIIDDQVNEMLENDIIEPINNSAWASNVVLVKKHDGGLRFCVDYRRLNSITHRDSFPLPRTDTCLDSLGGSTFFSTLDLRQGYFQVPMAAADKEKTAFITRRGIWAFKVMSFGLCNAPSQFSRLIEMVLSVLSWEICLAFLDDIVVFSQTFQQHMERLALAFDRLKAANLKLKPSKCKILQCEVKFLGNVVSKEGISPDAEKVKAVVDWPVPKNVTEVRTFTGLASYYRRHIKSFAEIARPLHELTKKSQAFTWGERQQQAFDTLKCKLVSAPVLASPTDEGEYALDTDASGEAVGAVLSQWQNGELKVISYASRVLTPAEKSYCVTRKELLAIVYGLRQYRHFLLARRFELRTDHAALTYLLKSAEPVGQQARYLDLLSEYDFCIAHRSGSQHGNADALSRRLCDRVPNAPICRQCKLPKQNRNVRCRTVLRPDYATGRRYFHKSELNGPELKFVEAEIDSWLTAENTDENTGIFQADDRTQLPQRHAAFMLSDEPSRGQNCEFEGETNAKVISAAERPAGVDMNVQGLSKEVIAGRQQADSVVGVVLMWISSPDCVPPRSEIVTMDPEVQDLYAQKDLLEVRDGILYRQCLRPDGSVQYYQLVVPRALRAMVLENVHSDATSGHFGVRKTQEKLQKYAYWRGHRKDVERFVRQCATCCRYKHGPNPKQGPMQLSHGCTAWQKLHVDLTGLHVCSKNGYNYLLTVICSFSKYLVAVPLRDKSALSVARAIVRHVYLVYSAAELLVHDQGREFCNEINENICRIMGI